MARGFVVGALGTLAACSTSDPPSLPGFSGSDGSVADAGGDDDGSRAGEGGGPGPNAALSSPDAGEDAKVCADVETTPVRSVPSVVFLVDGSTSMECVYPEDADCGCDAQLRDECTPEGDTSRWQALQRALFGDDAGEGLVGALASQVRFGLRVYHDDPLGAACPGFVVQVDPALDQGDLLAASFPDAPPGRNTPTGVALTELVADLPDAAARDAAGLGPQRIVLATDGQPFACVDRATLEAPAVDYAGVLAATDAAVQKDIDVYALSLAPPSGDFESHLEDVAQRGRTAQPYAPADSDDLDAALRAIIEDAISCTVTLEGEIEDPGRCPGTATLGETELACGDPDGFSIADASHVRLEGAACERFKREPGIVLEMRFACTAFRLQ